MALDTQVHADPAACRITGWWLRDVADRVYDVGTVLQRATIESETVWTGAEATTFREHLRTGRRDADELSWAMRRCGDALVGFAADVDTVLARMDQARAVAAVAGLTVTPTGIEPPGPSPSVSVAEVWTEIQTTVAQGREVEQSAHDTLVRKVRAQQAVWESIGGNSPFLAIDTRLSGSATLRHAGNLWHSTAAGYRADAAVARAIVDNPHTSSAERGRALSDFLRSSGQERAATRRRQRYPHSWPPRPVTGGHECA